MKWTYSVRNKMVASAALFALCLLVLFSNYIDQDHTNNVKKSISTLYEDRLIVEDYILKMTSDVYQIKESLNAPEADKEQSNNKIKQLLADINGLSDAYLKTKFTASEDIKFAELLKIVNEFESSPLYSKQVKLEIADKAIALLAELSAIQLEESKLIMQQAENLYISGKASSQFAFAVILIILLVLQALVFTSKTLTNNKQTSTPHVN